jgi:hypothetical protein
VFILEAKSRCSCNLGLTLFKTLNSVVVYRDPKTNTFPVYALPMTITRKPKLHQEIYIVVNLAVLSIREISEKEELIV